MNSDFEELLSLFNANAGKLSGGPLCQRVVQQSARAIFLRQRAITYVYVEPNSRGMGPFDGRSTTFLQPVFTADQITLYRVAPNEP